MNGELVCVVVAEHYMRSTDTSPLLYFNKGSSRTVVKKIQKQMKCASVHIRLSADFLFTLR